MVSPQQQTSTSSADDSSLAKKSAVDDSATSSKPDISTFSSQTPTLKIKPRRIPRHTEGSSTSSGKRRFYNSCHICKCGASSDVIHVRCKCGIMFCSRPRCSKRLDVDFVSYSTMLLSGNPCVHCRAMDGEGQCPNSNCKAKKLKGSDKSRKYSVGVLTSAQEVVLANSIMPPGAQSLPIPSVTDEPNNTSYLPINPASNTFNPNMGIASLSSLLLSQLMSDNQTAMNPLLSTQSPFPMMNFPVPQISPNTPSANDTPLHFQNQSTFNPSLNPPTQPSPHHPSPHHFTPPILPPPSPIYPSSVTHSQSAPSQPIDPKPKYTPAPTRSFSEALPNQMMHSSSYSQVSSMDAQRLSSFASLQSQQQQHHHQQLQQQQQQQQHQQSLLSLLSLPQYPSSFNGLPLLSPSQHRQNRLSTPLSSNLSSGLGAPQFTNNFANMNFPPSTRNFSNVNVPPSNPSLLNLGLQSSSDFSPVNIPSQTQSSLSNFPVPNTLPPQFPFQAPTFRYHGLDQPPQ